jgi:hypothetical protein
MPWKSAISLCRKSRMKNEADNGTRPNSSPHWPADRI